MRKSLVLAIVLFFTLVLGRANAAEMTVSGAASLTNAFTALKDAFEKKTPDCTVHTNFAASNPLLKQIQEGAPVDVFASADQETMDKAEKGNLIDPKTRKDFVRNDLVLIVPKGKTKPAKLSDISTYARIAIGTPASVPAGRYAQQSLTAAKLWEGLQSKFVYGNNVRQVLDYVARDEVDAGIVYKTDALKQKDKVEIALTLENHKAILYPIAVVNTGKNPQMGKKFVDFALSPEGQAILQKYGFMAP